MSEQNKKLPAVRQHVGPIAPIVPSDIDQLQRMANMMAASGFFQDARDMAQACVKIAAGAEYGLPPVVAMTGINVIKGRVTLSANTMAAIMKRAGYKLKVQFEGDHLCMITVIDPDGENLGESSFSMDDARKAGLGGDNWRKYPRNMLFARAVSNAARWYAPEVLTGAITPEELGEVEEPPVIDAGEDPQEAKTHDDEEALRAAAEMRRRELAGKTAEVVITPREMVEVVQKAEAAAKSKQAERRQLDQGDDQPREIFSPKSVVKEARSERWQRINKKIHAKLPEIGLDHDKLKARLPEDFKIRDASEDQLEALSSLLFSHDLESLRTMWKIVHGAYPGVFDRVKDHMKVVHVEYGVASAFESGAAA